MDHLARWNREMTTDTQTIISDISIRIDRIQRMRDAQRDELLATQIRLISELRAIRDMPSRDRLDAKAKSDRAAKALMSVVKAEVGS